MTIQAASATPRTVASRRRVIPAIGRAARSGSLWRGAESSAARGRGVVGGVVGRRVEDPAKHPREGSYAQLRCQLVPRRDSQPVTTHAHGLLDSRRFEHPFVLEAADAHLRPRRPRRRPRRPARRAVARPRRRPPRDPAAAPGGARAVPRLAGPAHRPGPRRPRHRAAVQPPGGGDRGASTPARTSSSSRRPRRARRCATRCRSSRPSPRTRPRGRCSCSRPRRSARTRSPSSPSCRGRPGLHVSAATYDGDTPAPIRSAIRAAGQVVVTNPDMLHSAILPHHTKWFQLFEQLRDHRHRRAAHLPRRVRQPRRQRPAPAAPDLRPLRQPPGHRLLLGDDREPGRARDDADRPPGRGHRPQRRPGRRAARPARRPAAARSGQRRPGLGRDPGPALGAAVPARRPPDDRVRAGAGRGRAAADRPARVAARELRAADRASGATAAATCRPSGARSSAACATARSSASSPRTRSSSASTSAGSTSRSWPAIRARSRRRGSSSGGPAGGRDERGGPRRLGRAGRPVRHPPPGVPARGHARGGPRSTRTTCTSCSPTCAPRRSSCRSSRARSSARRRPTTCSRSSPRRATSARRATAAGTGRARTSRPRRSRCGRPPRRTS